jgi:hypothetical protein
VTFNEEKVEERREGRRNAGILCIKYMNHEGDRVETRLLL